MTKTPVTRKVSRNSTTSKSSQKNSSSKKTPQKVSRKRKVLSLQLELANSYDIDFVRGPPPAHARYRVVSIPNSRDVLVFTWDQANLSWDNGRQMSREEARELFIK